MTDITTRADKGAPLTHDEVDTNFLNLKETADAAFDAVAGVGGKANAAALGTSDSDLDMGTTAGSILSDNGTAKDWFGELETAVEAIDGNIAPGSYDSYPNPWLISPSVGSTSTRLLTSTALTASGSIAPSAVIEYTYDGDAAVSLDFTGAPGGTVPGGLYVQHRQTGTNAANNAFTHSIMGYALNDAAGNNDVIAVSGRVRKNDVTDGIGDAAGVWGSAYQYSTKAGMVMAAEATIYQNVAGSAARDRLDGGTLATSVALHLGSYSTGSPATAIIAADGSGEGVWNYEIVDKNLFKGAATEGTVAYNCGSWDLANHPKIGWKVGVAHTHIHRGDDNFVINAARVISENTVADGAAGYQVKASGTGNAYFDLMTGGVYRAQFFWDGVNERTALGTVDDHDFALRTLELDRIVLTGGGDVRVPTIWNRNFASETAAVANGLPVDALYHSDGDVRIRSEQVTEYPDDKRPLIVVAWGGSNMVGWTDSSNGPRYLIDNAQIWDRGTAGGSLRPVNTSDRTYLVYCGNPSLSITTMGANRNSPAFGFAHRLQEETGRPVIIVPNCTGDRSIDNWISSGTASADWVALEEDLADVFALTGTSRVDYIIGQQGEVDTGGAVGVYATKLQTFITQVKDAKWWDARSSRMNFGEPCRAWTNTSARDYLLAELATVKALNLSGVSISHSLSGTGGSLNVAPPGEMTDSSNFSGRSLYSLGYYNYWEALPLATTGPKRTFAQLWDKVPWGADGAAKYPVDGVKFTRTAHLATAPLYTLAPAIAKVTKNGVSRLFVGATTNINNAGETGGSAGRLVWSDDDGATWNGGTTGGIGIGFVRTGGNVMEPNPWVAPDGKLWIFMNSTANSSTNDGRHGVHLTVIENPMFTTADLTVVPHPINVVPFGWCQKPEYINGQWMLPVSYWQQTTNGNDGLVNFVPYLQGRHYFTIDWINRKLTWAFHVADIDVYHEFDESSLTPLADGNYLASWRTLQGPYYSTTQDQGKTWTTPAAFTGLGTVSGDTAAIARHRTISGPAAILIHAWNNAGTRKKLTVAMSSGTSNIANFNPAGSRTKILSAGSSSYPDILLDGDNCYIVCDDGFASDVTPSVSRSATRRIRLFKFLASQLRTNAAGMSVTETIVIPGT